MKSQLDDIKDLNYEFVFAKKFEKEFVEQVVNKNDRGWQLSEFSNQDTYLPRAYSSANSHRECYEIFLNQNQYEWALVLEDDIILPKTIVNDIHSIIENFNEDWYHLTTIAKINYINNQDITYSDNSFKLEYRQGRGGAAYLINKKKALQYWKAATPIKCPPDVLLWNVNDYNRIPVISNINIKINFEVSRKSTVGVN